MNEGKRAINEMQFLSVLDFIMLLQLFNTLILWLAAWKYRYFRIAWLSKLFKTCLISLLWNGFCCCWTLILVSWQASCLSLVMISQLSSMSTLPLHHMQQCQVDWSIPLSLFAPLFGSKSMVKEKSSWYGVWTWDLSVMSPLPQ